MDFVKLDFVTPGSPSNGQMLPEDQSGSVIAWHNAIQQSGREMRLDISWKLDRTEKYFNIWNSNADSMRTDQDINNSGDSKLVNWGTVQRAIENYRQWIVAALEIFDMVNIYPDMDNLFVGNPESISGLSNAQRQTVMSHWIGAGANLVIGSDLTNLDDFGINLLTNEDALAVADFATRYPMQPRNPGSGGQDAKQVQAWVAGPDESGMAVVLLANYGPDENNGGFGTDRPGPQSVSVSFADLGLTGDFNIHDVWNDNNLDSLEATLDEGESLLLTLTPL